MKTILLCGKLFTAENDEVLENMAVVIDKNIIKQVCPMKDINVKEANVIDLRDRFVMPGFIDGHMHCTSIGAPDEDDSNRTAADSTLIGMDNLKKDLLAGFTTIRDEGCSNFEDVALKKAINQGMIDGPRMITSGKCITATGGHADTRYPLEVDPGLRGAFVCDSPDEVRKAVRTIFKYGADQVKFMGSGGVMSFGDDPSAPELTQAEMDAGMEVILSRGRMSSVHAHGAPGMKISMKAGIHSIEHGMLMDDEAIDMMAETGTYLVSTIIAAQMIVINGVESGIPEEYVTKAKQVIANHYANLKKCYKKGVKVCFGSDAGTAGNYHGKQAREFEFLKEAGFSPLYVLHSATSLNSELLRMQDQIGTITPGKFADIVAVKGNPLKNMKVMSDVTFVMKDGKIYKQ